MEQNDEFVRFVEWTPFPSWLTNAAGMLLYANQAMLGYLDSTQSQISGLCWLNFVPEIERARIEAFWQNCLESKSIGRTYATLRSSSDYLQLFELTCFFRNSDNFQEVWVFTVNEPFKITHTPEARIEDLQATLNVVPAHTWYADANGALTWVNDRTAEFLGLPEGHHLRQGIDVGADWQSHLMFLHPEDHAQSLEIWSNCLQTSIPNEVQFRIMGATGDYRWFLSRVEPLRNKDGKLLYWIGINLDIDDEKRAENALNATKEKLSRSMQLATVAELSASIAHEIIQPISAMVSNARATVKWLSANPPDVQMAKQSAEIILRDGVSAGNIIHEIRQLFKRQAPNKSRVNVNHLILQVLQVMQPGIRGDDISVILELDSDVPDIEVDGIQIQQVLLNLISNAIDSVNAPGGSNRTLLVRSRLANNEVVVDVEDSGIGISDPGRVFEAFFTTKDKGMGIGLAICQSIIAAHDGTLVAANRDKGGARFSFSLPL